MLRVGPLLSEKLLNRTSVIFTTTHLCSVEMGEETQATWNESREKLPPEEEGGEEEEARGEEEALR